MENSTFYMAWQWMIKGISIPLTGVNTKSKSLIAKENFYKNGKSPVANREEYPLPILWLWIGRDSSTSHNRVVIVFKNSITRVICSTNGVSWEMPRDNLTSRSVLLWMRREIYMLATMKIAASRSLILMEISWLHMVPLITLLASPWIMKAMYMSWRSYRGNFRNSDYSNDEPCYSQQTRSRLISTALFSGC